MTEGGTPCKGVVLAPHTPFAGRATHRLLFS
jgi:hypothetical protein